jgi:hypothetical protein
LLTVTGIGTITTVTGIGTITTVTGVGTIASCVAAPFDDLKLCAVVLGATLGNRHVHRLMIRSSNHGADAVDTSGKTAGDAGRKETIAVAIVVDALEKGKLRGIRRGGGPEIANLLNGDVTMANDVTVAIEALGRRVVVGGRVGEFASTQVSRGDDNVEVGQGRNLVARERVVDHGRNHVGLGWDFSHGDRVARAGLDLLTVSDGLTDTHVDEVKVVAACHLVSDIFLGSR